MLIQLTYASRTARSLGPADIKDILGASQRNNARAGITGALCFPAFFRLLRIRNPAAQGFAAGLSAHGLGTARAFLISEEVGAFAALGMGLNGIVTAVFLPLLLR